MSFPKGNRVPPPPPGRKPPDKKLNLKSPAKAASDKRPHTEMAARSPSSAVGPPDKKTTLDNSKNSTNVSEIVLARENLKRTPPHQEAGEPSTSAPTAVLQTGEPVPSNENDDIEVEIRVTDEANDLNDMTQLSCIKISRELVRLVGFFCEGKATSRDTIKFSVNPTYSNLIAKIDKFLGHNVSVSIKAVTGPRDYVWGKIFSHKLFNSDNDEILEQLQADNRDITIPFAKRIYKGASKEPTRLIRIKFSGNELPSHVYCCSQQPYEVTPYFPPVRQCAKCKKYGHWIGECKNEWVCKCGRRHDQSIDCQAPAFCIHCKENHNSNDPNCRKLKLEREIIAISHESNISFREARTKAVDGAISYATMAKRSAQALRNTNRPIQSVSTSTVVTVATASVMTGRDEWDVTMEENIDKCKSLENLEPTDIVITAFATTEQPMQPVPTHEWSENLNRISNVLSKPELIPEEKKDKYTRVLKMFLAHLEKLELDDASAA